MFSKPSGADRDVPPAQHPLILAWRAEREQSTHSGRFSPLEYRQHRFLSNLFFAVEQHGAIPHSTGHPDFVFVYEHIGTKCTIGPVDFRERRRDAKLRFAVLDAPASCQALQWHWEDDEAPLESKITEIVNAILVAVRANGRSARLRIQSVLETDLLKTIDRLKAFNSARPDSIAAQMDPRCFQHLVEMAEKHRSSVLVRRFLRALERGVPDRTVMVADQSLDDWFTWAARKADEYDPLYGGAAHVFERVAQF